MKYIKRMARAAGLKVVYNALKELVLKWRGFNLLGTAQTARFMAPYQISAIGGEHFRLPQIVNSGGSEKNIFPAKAGVTNGGYVWEYQSTGQNTALSKNGSVILQGQVLCTDWNHSSFHKDIWQADKRPVKTVPVMIALFSQLQDGIFYGGYYDFVFLVATKLCRIKDALPQEDLSNIIISYPTFNAAYETDYLQLLDVNTDNLVDSRIYKVTAPRLITANSAHWYPNLADILSLKIHIEKKVQIAKTASNRIYISRSGRRCIKNEAELITLLKKFDFLIIQDKKRTVTEQITIYRNASFILGPHGASFSNIIWCEPGTHLFELFSPNYVPDFFLYLATVMQLKYSAHYEGAANNEVDYLDGLTEDIEVSIPKLEAALEKYFDS